MSESTNNGDDKDLGISDDQIADNVAFQTRSSHGVWQPSFSNHLEKSASLSKPKTWSAPINTSTNFLECHSIASSQDAAPWQTYQDSLPNSGGS